MAVSSSYAAGPNRTQLSEQELAAAVVSSAEVRPTDARARLTAPTAGLPAVVSTSRLDPVDIAFNRQRESVVLPEIPEFSDTYQNQFAHTARGTSQIVLYTVNPELQRFVSEIVKKADAPHLAVVAMEPRTGRVLAIAQKSVSIKNLAFHAGFPAASLFKVVTAAAAIQEKGMEPETSIRYRGGTYVLERWNYLPDARRDRLFMSVADALGKSCNAVFGRIAYNHLSAEVLSRYADAFGFNSGLPFERRVPMSSASIPSDGYGLSRTAAGFGKVNISALHAAALMSGVANDGVMPKPYIIDEVLAPNGRPVYLARPESYRRMIQTKTAHTLMEMMLTTTTRGTSRREFMRKNRPVLGNIQVAAKTGTLSGQNPKGLNHWFIAAAPKQNPKIAIAVISVNPRSTRGRAARIGRQVIEKYLIG